MSTLLIRLAAPLQSWGAESKFDFRRTKREPTKSGVMGLLAAALGRRRDDDISDLCSLRFGVRVDQEGELLQDFHMVKKDSKTSYLTRRYYLCDAVFLAGVESQNEDLLQDLDDALRHPAFPLYLGRRSCPPTQPLALGIRQADLEEALKAEKWQVSEYMQKKIGNSGQLGAVSLRLLIDAKRNEETVVEKDLPISYDPRHRQYRYRAVTESSFEKIINDNIITEHDPMKELQGG